MEKLDRKDWMAVARSRAQRGKFLTILMGIGLVWLIGIMAGLLLCNEFSNLLYWVLTSVLVFIVGMVVVTIYIEARTKKIYDKIRKEE